MPEFESLAKADWSHAVRVAAAGFGDYKTQVIESLGSSNCEVVSAAIATLIEAESGDAHEIVVGLLDHPAGLVREEVLEYLMDFARKEDAPRLLQALIDGENRFLVTIALQKATGIDGPVLDEEDPGQEVQRGVEKWRTYIETQD